MAHASPTVYIIIIHNFLPWRCSQQNLPKHCCMSIKYHPWRPYVLWSALQKWFNKLLTTWSRVLLQKLTGFAANQEIPCILWNPKFHYRIHKCPTPVPIQSQLDRFNKYNDYNFICLRFTWLYSRFLWLYSTEFGGGEGGLRPIEQQNV